MPRHHELALLWHRHRLPRQHTRPRPRLHAASRCSRLAHGMVHCRWGATSSKQRLCRPALVSSTMLSCHARLRSSRSSSVRLLPALAPRACGFLIQRSPLHSQRPISLRCELIGRRHDEVRFGIQRAKHRGGRTPPILRTAAATAAACARLLVAASAVVVVAAVAAGGGVSGR